jgi:hypothetical protein
VDLGGYFNILIYTQSAGLFGRGISLSQDRYLHIEQHKHRINACRPLPRVGFEPTFPVFERAKTIHALDRAATLYCTCVFIISSQLPDCEYHPYISHTLHTNPCLTVVQVTLPSFRTGTCASIPWSVLTTRVFWRDISERARVLPRRGG